MTTSNPIYEKAVRMLDKIWEKQYKKSPNDVTPYFTVKNVDLNTLYKLYKEEFPLYTNRLLNKLSEEDFERLNNLPTTLQVDSSLFMGNPIIGEYQTLYDKYFPKQADNWKPNEKKLNEEEKIRREINQEKYNKEVIRLREKISGDIKEKFNRILSKNLSDDILNHSETLFFICIHFYNNLWDPYGLSFNGAVAAKNSINNLKFEEQPYDYRITNIKRYFGELLYDYYQTDQLPSKIDLVFRGKNHAATDPIILKWIFETLITGFKNNVFKIDLIFFGRDISNLINAKDSLPKDTFLNILKHYKDIETTDFLNVKKSVVSEYCLSIHTAFSYYLGLPYETFTIERLRVYIGILKLFNMEDLSQKIRNTSSQISGLTAPRKDKVENKLRTRLREALKEKESKESAIKD